MLPPKMGAGQVVSSVGGWKGPAPHRSVSATLVTRQESVLGTVQQRAQQLPLLSHTQLKTSCSAPDAIKANIPAHTTHASRPAMHS